MPPPPQIPKVQSLPPPRSYPLPNPPPPVKIKSGVTIESERGRGKHADRGGKASPGRKEEIRSSGSSSTEGGMLIHADSRQVIGPAPASPSSTPKGARGGRRGGMRGGKEDGGRIPIDTPTILSLLPDSLTTTPVRGQRRSGGKMRGGGRAEGISRGGATGR